MALPSGFKDELLSRVSLASVAGRRVSWDPRRSKPAKGDMWAPCPFHQEKTPSFHVDDRKGYYHCFGCGAKGDAIGFVMSIDNVGFMEAIEILARDAGMKVPAPDPAAREQQDRRERLFEVMEMAVKRFGLQLRSGAGAQAREYLDGRGLDAEALARFEIGFALDAWQGLREQLRGQGVEEELIAAAGLSRTKDGGGEPYDTFRNRIMFPIRDERGRCVAFGGRTLDPDGFAKYLNSPETEIFKKSSTLYNVAAARAAAGGGPLVVAEGYMDVIALARAGWEACVAPLGTAITERHLEKLWRLEPEPVIALDGDAAGRGAALRAADLALPMLGEGRSLRFALMPEGRDPDDVVRAGGLKAFQDLVDRAMTMEELLWQGALAAGRADTPERKAALEGGLMRKAGLIRDPAVRTHYQRALRDRCWKAFNPAAGRGGGRRADPGGATLGAKGSQIASEAGAAALQQCVALAALIAEPAIAEEFGHRIEEMQFERREHALLRDLVLRHAPEGAEAVRARIEEEMPRVAADLLAGGHVAYQIELCRRGGAETARRIVEAALSLIDADLGLGAEIEEAQQDARDGLFEESGYKRIVRAAERSRSARDLKAEDDAVLQMEKRASAETLESIAASLDQPK